MARRRMDIQTVVVGSGPVASLVVLKPHELAEDEHPTRLPIRIGTVEATAISMGVEPQEGGRPMTHDLLRSAINDLGATVSGVCISDVSGTTFFALVELEKSSGETISVDARPSDAIALAVQRMHRSMQRPTSSIRQVYPISAQSRKEIGRAHV